MARKLNAKSGAAELGPSDTAGSNVAARADIIRECAAQIKAIRSQRAELNEEMGDIRQRLKDAGILPKAVMEAVIKAEQDSKDRDAYEEARLEAWAALGLGTQGLLFGGGGVTVAVRSEATSDPDRRDELVEQGRKAYAAGGRREDCPWKDEKSREAWLEGYEAGQAATAAAMDPDTGSAQPTPRKPGQPPRSKAEKAGEVVAGHA